MLSAYLFHIILKWNFRGKILILLQNITQTPKFGKINEKNKEIYLRKGLGGIYVLKN